MATGLSLSRLVNVQVNLAPNAAQFPNLNTLLVMGTSAIIPLVQRLREYNSLAEVAADFGTNCEEYFSAQAWFGQNPQPTSILIGRWAKTAAAGQLIGGVLPSANQAISFWNAITTGSFTVHVDGAGAKNITGLDFSGDANLNAVATTINTALTGATAGASVAWDANTENFIWTSATTGAASAVSFLTPEGTGADISASIGGTALTGAQLSPGIAAETAVAALTIFDNMFSSQFYGVFVPSAVAADQVLLAAYVEGDGIDHFLGVNTSDPNVLVSSSTTDVAYLLKAGGYDKTAVQYSSQSAYAVVSMLARILTTNWQGQGTVITLMFKDEPGITPETLTASQEDSIAAKNCNVYVTYNGGGANLQNGVCSSGLFIDAVIGCDWFQGQIQIDVYNVLKQSTTKIPQTDAGMHQLATAIEAACQQGVSNGLIGEGLVWRFAGFGQLKSGDVIAKGYYVYTPPISSQAPSDRSARKSVNFQVAAILAGAVQQVLIAVTVSQ